LAEEAAELDSSATSPALPSGRPPPGKPPSGDLTPAMPGSWAERRAARKRRLTITAGVVAISMVVVAISGAVGAWIVGPQASSPTAVPLATTGSAPGELGGLLPEDAVLQNGDAAVTAQSIRPAVIAIVPDPCVDCEELLAGLAPQVGSFGVPLVAVGASNQALQLDSLSDALGTTRLTTLTDPQERLRSVYGSTGTILVLVRDNGVVESIVHNPLPGVRLESVLVDLVPGVGFGT
jgi:hypothetical protein